MRANYSISIISLIIGLPLAFCILFKMLPFGSIGPMVPITGMINLIILPPLLYLGASRYFNNDKWKICLLVFSVIAGVTLALLGVNIFMWLTHVFGIMDYNPM
jgi:hypothetical protein